MKSWDLRTVAVEPRQILKALYRLIAPPPQTKKPMGSEFATLTHSQGTAHRLRRGSNTVQLGRLSRWSAQWVDAPAPDRAGNLRNWTFVPFSAEGFSPIVGR